MMWTWILAAFAVANIMFAAGNFYFGLQPDATMPAASMVVGAVNLAIGLINAKCAADAYGLGM
jgi:hypothetical protein